MVLAAANRVRSLCGLSFTFISNIIVYDINICFQSIHEIQLGIYTPCIIYRYILIMARNGLSD